MFDAMSRRLVGALVVVGAQAGSALAGAPPPTPFDGQWIIDATASSVFCPVERGSNWSRLCMAGLSLNLKVFSVTAAIRGKMSGQSGAGDWSANNMLCARGDWRAAYAGN